MSAYSDPGLFVVGLVWMVAALVAYKRRPDTFTLRTTASGIAWYFAAVAAAPWLDAWAKPVLDGVYSHRVLTLSSVGVLFVLDDFVQYVAHRASHSFKVLWWCHKWHHTGTDFNILVGLRAAPWEQIPSVGFMLFEIFVGFDPVTVVAVRTASIIVQNTMHRRISGRPSFWAPLSTLFVTPAFHELHHGSNECYWDKNFGAVLNVWDRLFETDVTRSEVPVYGIK